MLKKLLIIYFILLVHNLFAQSPANVSDRLQWWFKANEGVSVLNSKSQIVDWKNFGNWPVSQINRSPLSTQGFPKLNSNSFNFNPGIKFSNDSNACLRPTVSDIANMLPTAKSNTTIIVFKSPQKQATTSSLHYYSPTIFTTETASTTLDYSFGFADGKVVVKCDSADTWAVNTVKSYNDNKCKIVVASRVILSSKNDKSFISLNVNGKLDINITVIDKSFILDGNNITYPIFFYGITIGAVVDPANEIIYSASGFNGEIAEIIVYDLIVNNLQFQKINSYLAIKYGVTLDQSNPSNYYASNDIIIWNATTIKDFNKNIAGIGKDDNSGLFQPKSKSDNDSSFVTISNPSDLQNLEFLTWSDNGKIFEAFKDSTVDVKYPIERRVEKVWQIQKTGNVGNVDLEFDISQIPGSKSIDDLVLVLDSNAIFNEGSQIVVKASSLNNNVLIFKNVNLMNKNINFFTIGTLNRSRTPLSKNVIESPNLVIYQLISPNNDNINDHFKILNIDYFPENELFIYNHEGNLIYKKLNFKNGDWDCSSIIDGHYFYIFNTNNKKYSGSLLIQRQ